MNKSLFGGVIDGMLSTPEVTHRADRDGPPGSDPGLEIAAGGMAGVPVLGGPREFVCHFRPESSHGLWKIGSWRGLTAGCLTVEPVDDLQNLIGLAYGELFEILRPGLRLYRVWHYLPGINEESRGMENYRAFCIARHAAFEREFGDMATRRMPAASAVGSAGGRISLAFVAGGESCRHMENPLQMPAYRYPAIHGPKPPSFARATSLPGFLFVSGTSSIRGHQTVHPGDAVLQVGTTLENLDCVLREAGSSLAVLATPAAFTTVYLRHDHLLPIARELLAPVSGNRSGDTQFLLADICRHDLDVEIETTVLT